MFAFWLTAQIGREENRDGEKEREQDGVYRKRERKNQVRKWWGGQDCSDNDKSAYMSHFNLTLVQIHEESDFILV